MKVRHENKLKKVADKLSIIIYYNNEGLISLK